MLNRAMNVKKLMFSLIMRAEPSHMQTPTAPGWKL
jgi:hypothetical protein